MKFGKKSLAKLMVLGVVVGSFLFSIGVALYASINSFFSVSSIAYTILSMPNSLFINWYSSSFIILEFILSA